MKHRSEIFLVVVLVLVTVTAYLPLYKNGFVDWDDTQYIIENESVKNFELYDLITNNFARNYHPLTMLSLAIDYSIFGETPQAFHYINLLLHILNSLLVAALILKLPGANRYLSFWIALIFAIHPLHVESVAWLSERKDVLSTFFFLLGLIVYTNEQSKGPNLWQRQGYYLVFGLFFLALNAKIMAATFPLVLFLFDYLYQRKQTILSACEKIPLLVFSVAYSLINIQAQSSKEFALKFNCDLGVMLGTALNSLAFSLYKSIFPTDLSIIYQRGVVEISIVQYLVALIICCAIGVSFVIFKNMRRLMLFGGLFFLLTIAPTTGIIPFGENQSYADRYLYLPSIGLFYLYGVILWALSEQWVRNKQLFNRSIVGLLVFVSVFFSYQANKRVEAWEDSETLFNDVISKYPKTNIAFINLGKYYLEKDDYNQAIYHYQKALEINPDDQMAHGNLGAIYAMLKQDEQALAAYKKAIEIDPSYVTTIYNLASLYQRRGQENQAIEEFQKVVQIDSGFFQAYYNLGGIYLRRGDQDEAIRQFQNALEKQPDYLPARLNLARVYQRKGLLRAALGEYERCLTLAPDDPKIQSAILQIATTLRDSRL
ncbi:MAG: tetratricopeptide repeat protein [Deltaproteobacteria bacterium]|nr:tetratricopeptide repeat protein [Deltaproteobacteria bacterium]